MNSSESRVTVSFYKYHPIENPQFFRDYMYFHLDALDVLGRIYIASAGINSQISVPYGKWDALVETLENVDFLKGIRLNKAIEDDGKSFFVLKIKLKDKIVADGLDDSGFDVTQCGEHIDAEQFNILTEKPSTVIVDMRNHYESEVGHFENALCPDVETFKEALPVVKDLLENDKDKDIILYCTGGIRCEKASAYYRYHGFKNVYQLNGGIIEYARQVQEYGLPNKFKGKNFVFDERLGERISDEVISDCHQCGKPSDIHQNCANEACHILFIQCDTCRTTYSGCCSEKCRDFIALPEEDQIRLRKTEKFNGTLVGKGRYKALKKSQKLS